VTHSTSDRIAHFFSMLASLLANPSGDARGRVSDGYHALTRREHM
jgi:hypothetical protein